MQEFIFNLPSVSVTIPLWALTLASGLLGAIFLGLGQRAERRGIDILSPNGHAQRQFRRQGRWNLLSYVMVLVFLFLLLGR